MVAREEDAPLPGANESLKVSSLCCAEIINRKHASNYIIEETELLITTLDYVELKSTVAKLPSLVTTKKFSSCAVEA